MHNVDQKVQHYLHSYFGLTGTSLGTVGRLFRKEQLSRGHTLVREGQYCKYMGFIETGYVRVHGYTPDGSKEVTQWLGYPETFVTELASFMFDTPSRWTITTLTDCSLLIISQDDYRNIADIEPQWPQLENAFLAKCFVMLENRVFEQLSLSAAEKVNSLMSQSPEIFNQVPLQYIASMLGMTPETLSRIRKKLSS